MSETPIYTTGKYILDALGAPVEEHDLLAWARWMGSADALRVVARTEVRKGVVVSTVFVGLDMNPFGGEPHLWETAVFRERPGRKGKLPRTEVVWRYASRAAAEAGHRMTVAKVRGLVR